MGKRLIRVGQPLKYEIIGVAKDFHFESLHQPIRPLAILVEGQGQLAAVRIRPERVSQTVHELEKTWQTFAAGPPFVYSFLDQEFDALYQAEHRLGKIVILFSALAISIACLGLLGLAAFAAEQRTKEIGIRKVLGATVPDIIVMLSKDFLKLVLFAIVLAAPLSYLAIHRWLENFAYRITIGADAFIYAGLAAVAIAFATVSFHALKAALANPVEALKYE